MMSKIDIKTASFPQKRESIHPPALAKGWTPACAEMTIFYCGLIFLAIHKDFA